MEPIDHSRIASLVAVAIVVVVAKVANVRSAQWRALVAHVECKPFAVRDGVPISKNAMSSNRSVR